MRGLVFSVGVGLLVVLYFVLPRPRYSGHIEIPGLDHDINSIRYLAALVEADGGDPLRLAPDGRIDVYQFVRRGEIEGPDNLKIFVSAQTGKGPTLEEILAGDYTSFPYDRFRGTVSPDTPGVPLLWTRRSRRGLRIVGLTQGRQQIMEEIELHALLRQHGQLDLPEGP